MTILSFIFADVQLINRQTSVWHAMQYIFIQKYQVLLLFTMLWIGIIVMDMASGIRKKKRERNLIHVTVEGTKIEEIRAIDNNFPIRISDFMRNCN